MLDGILYSIVNIGISLILIILSWIMLKINRKKFFIGAVLSIIFTGLAVYYLCLVSFLYPRSVLPYIAPEKKIPEEVSNPPSTEIEVSPDFTVIIVTEDNTFALAPEGELEIKKGTKFKIEKVVYPSGSSEEIKADIRGFAGNPRVNDLQDMGYWAAYSDMIKKYAVTGEKDKFEVLIRKDKKEIIGKVYIKFID